MVNGNYSDMGLYKDVQEDDTRPQSAHTYVHSPHLSIHHPCAGPIVTPGRLSNVRCVTAESLTLEEPEAHLGCPTSTYPRDGYCFFPRKCLGPSPARTTTNSRRRDGDEWEREAGPEWQRKSRDEGGSIYCRKLPSSRVGYIPRGECGSSSSSSYRTRWRMQTGIGMRSPGFPTNVEDRRR